MMTDSEYCDDLDQGKEFSETRHDGAHLGTTAKSAWKRSAAEHQPQRHGEVRRFGIIRRFWASALAAAGPSDTAALQWWFQDAPQTACSGFSSLPPLQLVH